MRFVDQDGGVERIVQLAKMLFVDADHSQTEKRWIKELVEEGILFHAF